MNIIQNPKYYSVYKPFKVLSQFTSEEGKASLADLYHFEDDVYPIGRLDYDSEGLLILTNDNYLKYKLIEPKFHHERVYLVQVEGLPDHNSLDSIKNGVLLNIRGRNFLTDKCEISILEAEPDIPQRNPPIRFRKNIPTSWLKIILSEGKNRQVRKMTASVGLPTLRLIRFSIENLTIGNMISGEVRQYQKDDIYKKLNIKLRR
ncbi:MAG: pseudouridine synthase [Candidatus Kapabacteria bacterium]|nr:pseudouridine synthase [Candidatus Kapabacteria bacterium]